MADAVILDDEVFSDDEEIRSVAVEFLDTRADELANVVAFGEIDASDELSAELEKLLEAE